MVWTVEHLFSKLQRLACGRRDKIYDFIILSSDYRIFRYKTEQLLTGNIVFIVFGWLTILNARNRLNSKVCPALVACFCLRFKQLFRLVGQLYRRWRRTSLPEVEPPCFATCLLVMFGMKLISDDLCRRRSSRPSQMVVQTTALGDHRESVI